MTLSDGLSSLHVLFQTDFTEKTTSQYFLIKQIVFEIARRLSEGSKEMLFNDALNTLYLWLYGVRHMLKGHSNSERGNPLPPHGIFIPINSNGSFICTIPHTG